MPKVNEAYFENKKNGILDTVQKILREKPLYKLTMKDIIKESGLSPGAVYDSFSDIDEVIIALVNRLSVTVDFKTSTNHILQTAHTPEEKIEALFSYLLELIHSTVETYGKILHELNTALTDANRRDKVAGGIHEAQMYNYVLEATISLINENIANGYFKPTVSTESIYTLLFAFFDGFVRDLTYVKCYRFEAPMSVTFEDKDLPKALAASVIFLLNHK